MVAAAGPEAVEPLATVVEQRPDWFRRGESGSQPATPAPWQAAHLLAQSGDPRAVVAVIRQLDFRFERLAVAFCRNSTVGWAAPLSLPSAHPSLHHRQDPDAGLLTSES